MQHGLKKNRADMTDSQQEQTRIGAMSVFSWLKDQF